MTPDYQRLLKGATTWNETHRGVSITLSHHGYRNGSEYLGAESNPGIWCYYLNLVEEMFKPDDWAQLWITRKFMDWGISYDYENFPGLDFHGGITFYESNKDGFDKAKKKQMGRIKVGCDYAHLWDMERGYPDTYDSVLRDAKNSVDQLLLLFPNIRTRCDYSGIWGEADEFYTAVNGRRVHKSHADSFEDGWAGWRPDAISRKMGA